MKIKKKGMTASPRKQILKAVQKIISQKNLEDSSISEIAGRAGVTDSIIYHYFKNKEDLLFYALADKLTDVEKDLRFHLEGVLDPVSRLSKMIWHHLYVTDLNPDDSRTLKNLLIECRSNKNFYTHEGYNTLREYTRFMGQTIQQGVDENVFRPDINVNLILNLILGLLDEESLSCLASGEIKTTMPDFKGIMDLVFAIISSESVTSINNDDNNKKKRILKAAVQVFAQKGYNAATMNEIANIANVSEGTIYNYFKNKEDLLFSIPKKRLRRLKKSGEEMFDIQHPIKKLRRFIRLLFTIFMEDRDFTKVFLLEIKLNKKFYNSILYKDYIDYVSILESILKEGQKQGIFRYSVDPRLFRNMFIGAFTHLAIKWTILKKEEPIDMLKEIEKVVEMLCRSVVADNSIITKLNSIYK
ncbi:TetR/AcrR family transcriptional regulator [Desulfobacula phenolica]|uniref:Transcriptional regulator, TetR family n=1 Tax=Desulfobacula phenolica TaxID=90732 RepID=A0A1H2JMW4_9BACT|nr:TetR/AcrR family transcriptional regulator [Desulfobacula phenolica]SDU57476.1 transcriptional regulator, TetR family [Desulfobacula phenolica]